MNRFYVIGVLCAQLTLCSAVIIQRTNGFDPDRFTLQQDKCDKTSCSLYEGVILSTQSQCQCECSKKAPTFSLNENKCIIKIKDCNGLKFYASKGSSDIFTFQVRDDGTLYPELQVISTRLNFDLGCPNVSLSIQEETIEGYSPLTNIELGVLNKGSSDMIYSLKFNSTVESAQIQGKLYQIHVNCDKELAVCLPMKTSGYYHDLPAPVLTTSANKRTQLSRDSVFIIIGVVIAVVVIIFVGMLVIAECKICRKKTPSGMDFTVERVKSEQNTLERRKKTTSSKQTNTNKRSSSMRETTTPHYLQHSYKVKPLKRTHSLSDLSGDSGRGSGRGGSAISLGQQLEASFGSHATTAASEFESTHFIGRRRSPPRLFKSHQARLSTVGHGIQGMEVERSKERPRTVGKRFSEGLRKIFRMKADMKKHGGSHLTIDYDHFTLAEAPKPKLFTNAHINPDVSFDGEGKVLNTDRDDDHSDELGATVEMTLPHDGPIEWQSIEPPVTNIDDVDLTSQHSHYEDLHCL